MSEPEKRMHRCCFTGHRPEKLNIQEDLVIQLLETQIRTALARGYTTFISGMAKGVDIWAAEIVLKLRKSDPRIKLICALPFPEFGRHWEKDWTDRLQRVLDSADYIKAVSPVYSGRCFQKRNEWMVNHSKCLIAAFNGTPGGTRNTIEYAQKIKDIEICYIPLN